MTFWTCHSRPLFGAGAAAILSLTLTACGAPTASPPVDRPVSTTTPSAPVTSAPTTEATVIEITLDGETVEPSGTRVEVELGRPVILRIDAAEAGELHVHSSPEQEISFPAGASEHTLTLDQPGIVDVEDHALDALIVQLQVS